MNLSRIGLIARTDLLRHWRRGWKISLISSVGLFAILLGMGWLFDSTLATHSWKGPSQIESCAPVPGVLVLTGGDCRLLREEPRLTVLLAPNRKTPPMRGELLLELPTDFERTLGEKTPPKVVRTLVRGDESIEELDTIVIKRLEVERLSRLMPGVDRAGLETVQSRIFDYQWKIVGASSEALRSALLVPFFYCFTMLISAITDVGVRDKTSGGLRHLILTSVPGEEIVLGKVLALSVVAIATLLTSVVGLGCAYALGRTLADFTGEMPAWRVLVLLVGVFAGMVSLILGVMATAFSAANTRRAGIMVGLVTALTPMLIFVCALPGLSRWCLVTLPLPLAGTQGVGLAWLTGEIGPGWMLAHGLIQIALCAWFFRVAVNGLAYEEYAEPKRGCACPPNN